MSIQKKQNVCPHTWKALKISYLQYPYNYIQYLSMLQVRKEILYDSVSQTQEPISR